MDDDWYNASLPRYPRVLIRREMNSPAPIVSHTYQRSSSRGNVIRIRVQGRHTHAGETSPPRVSIHQYSACPQSPTNQVSAETVRSGVATPLPVQIRRMTSPPLMTNTSGAQQVTIPIAHIKGPMRAVPLSQAVRTDSNSNLVTSPTAHSPGSGTPRKRSPSPSMSRMPRNNSFDSFEKEFDRITAELSRHGIPKPSYFRSNSNSDSTTSQKQG